VLQGNRYALSEDDLAYRQLGEKRAVAIKDVGEKARTAWLAAHKADVIETFPGVDPITGDVASVAGKLVVLPDIRREEVTEAGDQTWAVVRGPDRDSCTYFVNGFGPAARRMFDAVWRYSKLVTPNVQPTYLQVIGKVLADPRMVTTGSSAVTGLEVEIVAVTIDQKLFVDLSVTDDDGNSPLAGEDQLRAPASALPDDDASPRDVMHALVAAIEAGDEATFKALYAGWRAVPLEDGRLLWYPWYGYRLERRLA
jgi:hypothetical protein